MSKKVKIYCYKLAKPVVKSLRKNLDEKVGRVEYNDGFIKEYLGIIYLITIKKLSKGDEIALSNDFKFSYGGSLFKKINYTPYETDGIDASDGSFLIMPGKSFLETVDPNNTCIETVILDDIVNKFFKEEKQEIKTMDGDPVPEVEETPVKEEEIIPETPAEILNTEPVVSQVTIEEQVPLVSTDPLDKLINIEEDFEPDCPTPMSSRYSENPEEWFEENMVDMEELEDKIDSLEKENFKLSNKINNTIEEIKNITVWDILFGKWKSKLLDILNL